MNTRTWIRRLFPRKPRAIRKGPARCQPVLEVLETRALPAVSFQRYNFDFNPTGPLQDFSLPSSAGAALSGNVFGSTFVYYQEILALSDLGSQEGELGGVEVLDGPSPFPTFFVTQEIEPDALAAGDFNGDGKLDLAVADYIGGVSILLNTGQSFALEGRQWGDGPNPVALAAGDFNGDGKTDLAVVNSGNDTVSLLLGNGDGTFQSPINYAVGSGLSGAAAADLEGDGRDDLVVADSGDGTVAVLRGQANGTFAAPVYYAVGAQPRWVALGDLNGDGKPDIVVANSGSNSVSVLLNNGDGTFQPAVNYAVGMFPRTVALGDLNQDGKLDIVTANQDSNSLSCLLGHGDGTFTPASTLATGDYPIAAGIATSRSDLFVINSADASFGYYVGFGQSFFTPVSNPALPGAVSSVAGDFNGDGHADLATLQSLFQGPTMPELYTVTILLGRGDGTFTESASYSFETYDGLTHV